MATQPDCFSRSPSVVLPDRTRVLANLTNGGAGRALAEAILDGRIDDARAMIAHDPRLLTTVVTHDPRMDAAPAGQSGDLLTLAVSRCNPDIIAMLIESGASPNGAIPGQALALALIADTPVMADFLLSAGASPDPQTLPGGIDAMGEAIMFSRIGAVMTLLRHGANPRWHDAFGIDRVRQAVDAEQVDIAELLVAKGGSPWTIAEDGSTAVHELMQPPVAFNSPAQTAVRARLIEVAKSSGLPWPPPDRATIKRMVQNGNWPTAAMTKAGMVATPEALARMHDE
jgi:hypothetical protein